MVRQAVEADLSRVAAVHRACFPDSFSTTMGERLLARFYREYLQSIPELFLVAEDCENKIIGFCMGYYCENNPYMKRFLKNNALCIGLRMIWLLSMGNKAAWKKVASVILSKRTFYTVESAHQNIPQEQCGDLLSICVIPEYRGTGIAQEMVDKYLQILLEKKRKACLLSVAIVNERGIRFYERNGFMPFKEAKGRTRKYIKLLK